MDWRQIAEDPTSARVRVARRRKKGRASKIRFLTPDQAKKLLAITSGDRFETLYLLALTTGMREGELFGLKWSDLDLERRLLTVNHSLSQTKRKKGEKRERVVLKGPKNVRSRRTIEIPDVAVASLQGHAAHQAELKRAATDKWTDEGYVFTTRLGKPLDRGNALHRFQRILENNELPKFRLYDLRPTHASLLIAERVHPKKIAERLGHASIKLTMDLYGHLFEGSNRESAERMDRLFRREETREIPTAGVGCAASDLARELVFGLCGHDSPTGDSDDCKLLI
jgi:integrase